MRKNENLSRSLKRICTICLLTLILIDNICYAKVMPKSAKKNEVQKESIVQSKYSDIAIREYKNLENSILKNKNCSNIQEYIDKCLVNMVGQGAEWEVILFYKMYGNTLDYSKYKNALDYYVKNKKISSEVTMQLIALSYLCVEPANAYLDDVCDMTIGKYGIMSFIFGLHLLNNGLVSTKWTKDMVINKLIDMMDVNNGYSYMGNETDIDVTSMVIQAMAPYYYVDEKVKKHIDKNIDLISKKQLSDGSFLNSGMANSESLSQVVLMASCMNIDLERDNRFIKNDINIYKVLDKFKTKDGLYSHILDGENNTLSTMQAFYSLGSMTLNKTNNTNLFKIRY